MSTTLASASSINTHLLARGLDAVLGICGEVALLKQLQKNCGFEPERVVGAAKEWLGRG
jgi:hypothetical protein